jgi:transcriptional regulator with XRE-family HTH domain
VGADVQSAKSFGLLVRRYWAVAALTQEELASRAGLSVRAVSDMEHDRTRRPFLRSMRQLADALGLAPPERTAPPTGHRQLPVADGIGWIDIADVCGVIDPRLAPGRPDRPLARAQPSTAGSAFEQEVVGPP